MMADETGSLTVTWFDRTSDTHSLEGTASVEKIVSVNNAVVATKVSSVNNNYGKASFNNRYYEAFLPEATEKQKFTLTSYVKFSITVPENVTFTPTSVSAYMIGLGTGDNGAKINVGELTKTAISEIGNSKYEATATAYIADLTGVTAVSGKTLDIYIYMGHRDNNSKGVGIGDVKVTGTYVKKADTRTASDLTIADGKQNIALPYSVGSFTLTKGTDYTTSSTGAITYTSSEPTVATVTDAGVITWVGEGSTVITLSQASDANYQAGQVRYNVTVTDDRAASTFALTSESSVTIGAGATSNITTSDNAGTVTYESNNTSVAIVDASGKITGVSVGSAVITVKDAGSNTVKPSSTTVNVTVPFGRKETTNTEFVVDANTDTNGSLDTSNKTWLSKDESLLIQFGTCAAGSNTYFDIRDKHFKSSGDVTITLPKNFTLNTLDILGYANGTSDAVIKLVAIDGVPVDDANNQAQNLLKKDQIPACDGVTFGALNATESVTINISREVRAFYVLNRKDTDKTLNDGGDGLYYGTYYNAAETKITGARVYKAELSDNALNLVKLEDGIVPARTGVVVIGDNNSFHTQASWTNAIKGQGSLIGASDKNVAMANYYKSGASAASKVFTFGKNDGVVGFYKYTGTTLAAKKAYLYSETLGGSSAKLSFKFADDDATTVAGVAEAKAEVKTVKFVKNGQFLIKTANGFVNAAGAQVK